MKQIITAEVIECPSRWGDGVYRALEISIEGLTTPYHCVLALPANTYRDISGQVDPAELYAALAEAINQAGINVEVRVG